MGLLNSSTCGTGGALAPPNPNFLLLSQLIKIFFSRFSLVLKAPDSGLCFVERKSALTLIKNTLININFHHYAWIQHKSYPRCARHNQTSQAAGFLFRGDHFCGYEKAPRLMGGRSDSSRWRVAAAAARALEGVPGFCWRIVGFHRRVGDGVLTGELPMAGVLPIAPGLRRQW